MTIIINKKSLVGYYFDKWLEFMETPAHKLSKEEFTNLENKIKKEIAFHRKNRKEKKRA